MNFQIRLKSPNLPAFPGKVGSGEPHLLAPFFKENPENTIERFQLLHARPLSRSFLVEFRKDSQKRPPIVLKSFSIADREHAAQEVRHLELVGKFVKEKGLNQVLVPQVVWAATDKGLFATRYIPGENLDTVYRKHSRLWSISSGHNYASSATVLLKWHRAFHDGLCLQRESLLVADNQATDWTKWVQFLTHANRLPLAWRKYMGAKLARLEKVMAMAHEETGGYHGDFTPWNIRVEPSGQLWVLDWHLLERGHWLEGAYRFMYTLRVSALSPLAKRGFFVRLWKEANELIENFDYEGNRAQKELFQLRAVLRNLFYLCKRPSLSLKQRGVQRFWVKELTEVLEKCTS